jgi:hypothetical protein
MYLVILGQKHKSLRTHPFFGGHTCGKIYTGCVSFYVNSRPWKDHFKSDLKSDQDHLLKKDLRSDQDHIFLKSDLDLKNQDQRSFFAPKVPFLRVKISKRTKSRF